LLSSCSTSCFALLMLPPPQQHSTGELTGKVAASRGATRQLKLADG
jgi:hypothetical protein